MIFLADSQNSEEGKRDVLMPDGECIRHLEALLLTGIHDTIPLFLLRDTYLAAFAFTVLSEGHPSRNLLYSDYMLATARHLNFKARLLPLINTWRSLEIEVLLFKGFYLAELVYEFPEQRHFQDVDILLRPDQISKANAIAQSLGWKTIWDCESAMQPYSHVALHLLSPDGLIQIDVHRRILHTRTPWIAIQQSFTEQAWKSALSQKWEDTDIKVLQPVDSLIIGLILNRCWSLDLWKLKPHDLLDFRNLVQRYGLTREALLARAEQLNCRRTVSIFLERCDPWSSHLDLRKPSLWERWRWEFAVVPERGHLGLERALGRLNRPGSVRDFLRELPTVLRVLYLLNKSPSLQAMLSQLDHEACPSGIGFSLHRIVRGVRLATRALGLREPRAQLVGNLAIFASLRYRGQAAYFCQGLASAQAEKIPYSWIEIDGRTFDWMTSARMLRTPGGWKLQLRYPK
jgi:Uncharacterised nucleotidyltransferase